jgi:hypothetical protein
MTDATDVRQKKRGRPATGHKLVALRFTPDALARIDAWAAEHDLAENRSEAIRRLVEKGLVEG